MPWIQNIWISDHQILGNSKYNIYRPRLYFLAQKFLTKGDQVIAMDLQRIDTRITEIIIFDIQGIDIQQDLIRPIDQKNIISRQKFD